MTVTTPIRCVAYAIRQRAQNVQSSERWRLGWLGRIRREAVEGKTRTSAYGRPQSGLRRRQQVPLQVEPVKDLPQHHQPVRKMIGRCTHGRLDSALLQRAS